MGDGEKISKKILSWPQQFEIIKEIFTKDFCLGQTFSLSALEQEAGITRGKATHWNKGQKPSANDLKKLGEALDLSGEWLLFGTGDPRGHREQYFEFRNLRPKSDSEPAPQVCPSCSSEFAGHIVNVHSTAGAGPAREHWEPEPMHQVCIPERFYWQSLLVIQVEGSSMEPLIKKGAFVGLDTAQTWIVAGEIYAVQVPYEGLTLKRVFVDPENDRLRLQSENPRHPEQTIAIEGREGLVVGKAIWVMQEI